QDLEAELLAMRSAWTQAVSDRESLERRLMWFILDVAPALSPEGASSRLQEAIQYPTLYLIEQPSGGAARNPDVALASVEIRIQHAFARVTEVGARTSYLAACGRL